MAKTAKKTADSDLFAANAARKTPAKEPRVLAFDQRLERLADQCRLLLYAGVELGFGQQLVVALAAPPKIMHPAAE